LEVAAAAGKANKQARQSRENRKDLNEDLMVVALGKWLVWPCAPY
jgi:hypothetical protein